MLTGAVGLLFSRQTFKDVHKWVRKVPNKSMRISGIWRNKCVTKTGKHFWCAFSPSWLSILNKTTDRKGLRSKFRQRRNTSWIVRPGWFLLHLVWLVWYILNNNNALLIQNDQDVCTFYRNFLLAEKHYKSVRGRDGHTAGYIPSCSCLRWMEVLLQAGWKCVCAMRRTHHNRKARKLCQ